MEYVPPLKAYRERQEPPLTQKQLAELVGVSRETVTRWESGDRKVGFIHLPKISKVTGIPAARIRPDLALMLKDVA